MKEKLLALARAHVASISVVQRRVKASGAQIQDKAQLAAIGKVAAEWFDEVKPALQTAGFEVGTVSEGDKLFELLLKRSASRPAKSAVLSLIAECLALYSDKIIHQIQVSSFDVAPALSIAPYIDGLSSDEGEYLAEAQRCLGAGALRGCIVLGWCATVARMHIKIAELGYDVFNAASASMSGKTTGRYKHFNKRFDVASLSDMQRVFDTDLLFVLDFMELIDGNQHQRLRHCFEFRNNSAHPGLAAIKPANLYSFYSDISEIVLKNPKFTVNYSGQE